MKTNPAVQRRRSSGNAIPEAAIEAFFTANHNPAAEMSSVERRQIVDGFTAALPHLSPIMPVPAEGVTEEEVEAACKAHSPQWDGIDDEIKVYARQQMRAALLAARRVRPSPVDEDARDGVLEEAAKTVEMVGNFRDTRRDELTPEFGQPRFDMMRECASAIRALQSQRKG